VGLFDKKTTKRSGLFGRVNTGYDLNTLNRQIDNAETRIRSTGYNPEQDKRNWLEKATNLPEGQNAFFDALELLGRPGQGVMNTIHKKGGNNLNEFARGLSGQDKVRGTDLVGDSIQNPAGKFIAGLGIEILTDPVNLIPGGVFLKGAKGLGSIAKGSAQVANKLPVVNKATEALTPAAKGIKDSLGYMFNTKHGRDQIFDDAGNLVKGEDKLTPMIQQTDNSMRYQNVKNQENVINAAKVAGGYKAGDEVGRALEAPLKQFDEAGNVLPRPQRELSTDPKIEESAKMLMTSNDALRNQAKDLGIDINELEGYMRHILSKEEQKLRKTKGESVYNVDKGNFGLGNPNDKFLRQRKLEGSVEDINEQLGRKFFEPNAFFATAYGQKQLTEYMHAASFRRQVLSDKNLAIPFEKGTTKVIDGTEKINTKNYSFLRDEDMTAMGLSDEVGGEYLVPKAVKNALDRYQKLTTDEGIKGFLKAFDTAQSWWKRAALFSVPYHLRNDVGAKFNNWVGGMNEKEIVKYSYQAEKEVYKSMMLGKASPMYDEYLKQGLGASSQSKIEFKQMGEDASRELERAIKEGSRDLKGKAVTRLSPLRAFETSREFGDFRDQANRFAMYKWARDKGMEPEDAAKKVRETQFDYTDLTNFEREFATRVVPFYRWMRNNIPYQIRQFMHDPRKHANINKARLNAQDVAGIDEENIPEWMKESFAIPVSGDGKGSGKFLGLNLPLGDLTRTTEPGKMGIDSLSPLLKMPVELGMNRNFFYDKPIEKFEGQEKQFRLPFTETEFGIPSKIAYAGENLTGQIGRGLSSYLQKPKDVDQDTKFRTPSLGISSVIKDFDVNKAKYFEQLEKLKKLQDLMNLIQQQTGQRPSTIRELNR
jgi:hypothetical protein